MKEIGSCSRVRLVIDVLELFFDKLGIDLGGRDIRVAEHLLNGVNVSAVLQQVRGERVPQSAVCAG